MPIPYFSPSAHDAPPKPPETGAELAARLRKLVADHPEALELFSKAVSIELDNDGENYSLFCDIADLLREATKSGAPSVD